MEMTHPVPAATQHSVVQIAREALFNVVRHAGAHHAWVTLRRRPQVVSLAVADDGWAITESFRSTVHLAAEWQASRTDRNRGAGARRSGAPTWFERRRGGGVKLRVEVPLGGSLGPA